MIDFLRARGPEIGRFVLIILALILAFLIGQRSVEGHTPTPAVTADAVFRAFELPDAVLPSGCCRADDTPEHPFIAGPASSAAPSAEPIRRAKAHPGASTRTVGRAVHGSFRDYHHNIRGVATWHATGRDGAYAAAGPLLRRAMGRGWRGDQVLVCGGKRCLIVTLNDWCLCSRGDRLVDLSDEAFRYLAPLSRGVIKVAVGW